MNEPHMHNFTFANRVESETAPVLTETMEAHPSVSRTLELLAADMNAYPERLLPVDTCLVTRIISLVGQTGLDLNTPLFAEDE